MAVPNPPPPLPEIATSIVPSPLSRKVFPVQTKFKVFAVPTAVPAD